MSLAEKLAHSVAAKLDRGEEKQSVIAYGLLAVIQLIELVLIIGIIGGVTGCLPEALLILILVGVLRRSAGGTHCKTYAGCMCISTASACILALFCRHVIPLHHTPAWYAILGMLPVFSIAYGCGFCCIPKPAENKPLSPEKRVRLRRQYFITLLVFVALACLLLVCELPGNRNISMLLAILAALLWQAFTLTRWSGHLALSIDHLFPTP